MRGRRRGVRAGTCVQQGVRNRGCGLTAKLHDRKKSLETGRWWARANQQRAVGDGINHA